jgi:ribosomal protein L7Ae-like RNA K-turn-binding protein
VAALYCLNRRKLGKAVHSSMKQVVVAVIDADGAYENYKKIIAFINKPVDDCS